MKKILFHLFLFFGVFFISQFAWAKDNDFQLWTELKYTHPFEKTRWEIFWATENRFRNDASDYFFFNTTLGFQFKAYKWFSTGFAYRLEMVEPKAGGDFRKEHRLMPQFELSGPLGPFRLRNRHLFEARFFTGPYDFRFRYRNRIRIERPFKTSPVSFTPYVSEEFFVETEGKGLNQNRFIVGNAFGFLKNHVSFDLYYLLRRDKETTGWINVQVLGTSLGFKY